MTMGKESKRNYKRGTKVGALEGAKKLHQHYENFVTRLGAVEFLEAAGWTQEAPYIWVHEKTLADSLETDDYKKLGLPTLLAVAYEALRK
jgi:hypothetical protein